MSEQISTNEDTTPVLPPAQAVQQVVKVSKIKTKTSTNTKTQGKSPRPTPQRKLPAAGTAKKQNGAKGSAPVICEHLKQRLLAVIDQERSGSALLLDQDALVREFGRSPSVVKELYAVLLAERNGAGVDASAFEDLERHSSQPLQEVVAVLIPPQLAAGFKAIRESIEYHYHVLLAVLITGLAAALPLESSIELDEQTNYSQPLTIWLLVLMPSGELKSPLIYRLISGPWQEVVEPLMDQAHQRELMNWKAEKQSAEVNSDEFDRKKPSPAQTLISGSFSPQGLESSFVEHDRWANRSVLLEFDEGAGRLQQLLNPPSGDLLSSWILSRYDGKGSRNALVDPNKQRVYSSCRLGMVVNCQPERYKAIAGDGDQSGMNARFLAVEQLQVRQDFRTTYSEEQKAASKDFDALLRKLYRSVAACQRLRLRLSPEAFELFQVERQRIDALKRSCVSDAERTLLSKSAGKIGRLAGIFHLLWQVTEDPSELVSLKEEEVVSVEAMERAIAFHQVLLDQTVAIRRGANEHGTPTGLALTLHLKTWLLAGRSATLNQLRGSFSGKTRPRSEDALAALRLLAEMGCGSLKPIEYRGHRGWAYTASRALSCDG